METLGLLSCCRESGVKNDQSGEEDKDFSFSITYNRKFHENNEEENSMSLLKSIHFDRSILGR